MQQVTDYFGTIEIKGMDNFRNGKPEGESDDFKALEQNAVQFIHYPDCQQLCIWLPYYGPEYRKLRLINTVNSQLVKEWNTSDILSGSIQLIWNTLPVSPGEYMLEIDWKNGWKHRVSFNKNKHQAPVIKKAIEINTGTPSPPFLIIEPKGAPIKNITRQATEALYFLNISIS